MSPDEIMAKAKYIFEHVEEINSLGEARQAVKDAASMIYYLARGVKELSPVIAEGEKPKAGSFEAHG